MSADRGTLSQAAELLAAREPFVMATVVRTQGSTPRDVGARMIWRPAPADPADAFPNGAIGTIGGGQFEQLVLDAAKACFDRRASVLERFVLGSDADQCCGGVVEVFIEYHGRPARVVVFGAGHVAQALYDLLAPAADSKSDAASLGVVIVDDRTDWNSADRFFHARRVHSWDEGVRTAKETHDSTLAVVMTCSHDTDFDLLRMLLAQVDRVPAFVGLIGSRSKRACLFGRLVASGIDAAVVQRVVCPVGVGDTGKEPRAVAISIAAQLLMEARALSDRSPGPGHTAARSDRHG